MAENRYIKEAVEALQVKRDEAKWVIDDINRQIAGLKSRNTPKLLAAQEELTDIDKALVELTAVQAKLKELTAP